jgi:hypothetical protein
MSTYDLPKGAKSRGCYVRLFDHPICAHTQRRHVEADCLGGLQVDHRLARFLALRRSEAVRLKIKETFLMLAIIAVAAAYKFATAAILFELNTSHQKATLSDLYLIHQQGTRGAEEHVNHPDRIVSVPESTS